MKQDCRYYWPRRGRKEFHQKGKRMEENEQWKALMENCGFESVSLSHYAEVHETAAGALWNLAFNPRNALRLVEEGGVAALVNLCAYSVSKIAPFMAALALAYIFDGRMDEVAHVGPADIIPKSVSLDDARKLALEHIDTFVLKFSDQQALSAAAASSTPATLAQVAEAARLPEAGQLRCSGAEIGRFVTMLRNSCCILQICAAFALMQFTFPNGRYAKHHANLLQTSGAARTLRATAAASALPIEVKIFIRIVLCNLAHHNGESVKVLLGEEKKTFQPQFCHGESGFISHFEFFSHQLISFD